MNLRPQHPRWFAAGCLTAALACATTGAPAQDTPATTYDEWRLLEPAEELSTYRARLREGTFDEAERNFLVQVALPQLGLPKNRPTIDRVRKRMRDVLCGDTSFDPSAAAKAMQMVTDVMVAAARDANADAVLRVNAALLVGELRAPGGKPWPPAAVPLAALLGDDALPPAVRVAAAAGLARLVDADPQARSADVGPALLKVVVAPLNGVDPVAAGWLRERSLAMLARMGSAAPNGTAAAAAGLLGDASRPVDLRVRAAATTGACIKAAGDTDAAAAVTAIGELAKAAIGATQAEIERRGLTARPGAGAPVQPQRGVAPAEAVAGGDMPQLFRRDAWRLATLADALAPASGDGGLARFAGARAAAATTMAQALRDGAAALDAQPDADSLAAAVTFLGEQTGGAPPATTPAAAEPAPAAPPAGDVGVPFGN